MQARFFAVDGHAPALEQDWRLFRARLVAQEMHGDATGAALSMLVRPSQIWAHQIPHPEPGCLLVARNSNLGMFSQSVVLVTEHDDSSGSSALVINMPTPIFIANLGLEESIADAFGRAPLFIGGPMTRNLLHVLHGRGDVEGAMRIIDGIYAGGVEAASDLVRRGEAAPSEFRLLAGYSGWGPGQLAREIAEGSWYVVAASHALILQCLQESGQDLIRNAVPGVTSRDDIKMLCWKRVLHAAGITYMQ